MGNEYLGYAIGSALLFESWVLSTVILVGLEKNQDVVSSVRIHLAFGNVVI